MNRGNRTRKLLGAVLLAAGWLAPTGTCQVANGWGIDACLTRHIPDSEFPAYVALLKGSGIRVLRERDIGERNPDGSYRNDVREKLRELKSAGFTVVAFASPAIPLTRSRPEDALPEDLRQVYDLGLLLRRDFAGLVDVWEMVGEPDVGYCRDLPERVAAYQKALYLGLKSGGGESPIVLMGALALPPGPWLERAADNGLLDYTDGYNFHFYGHSEDLGGVISAHRAFLSRRGPPDSMLPLWITECGIKAVGPDDFLDGARRSIQAQFTVKTALEARNDGVAEFMPFILVHDGDPYALTLSATRALPGWDAYAALTRTLDWPSRPASRPPRTVSPIVMQWLPDEGSAIPHKVSGTYRFREGRLMSGEIRIYNLGSQTVRGRFQAAISRDVIATFPDSKQMTLAAGQLLTLRGSFAPARTGYFQAWWRGKFTSDDGMESPLSFGLEEMPVGRDFTESVLELSSPPGGKPAHALFPEVLYGASAGPWVGINGVEVTEATSAGARFRVTKLAGDPDGDPFYPPQAIAAVSGLPDDGFLVLKNDRMFTKVIGARVDLVDDEGQRFTIWENYGQSYFAPSREIWLNLHDFHIYFWGRCSADPVFQPKNIREIQLRFFCTQAGDSVRIELTVARPNPITSPSRSAEPASAPSNTSE